MAPVAAGFTAYVVFLASFLVPSNTLIGIGWTVALLLVLACPVLFVGFLVLGISTWDVTSTGPMRQAFRLLVAASALVSCAVALLPWWLWTNGFTRGTDEPLVPILYLVLLAIGLFAVYRLVRDVKDPRANSTA